MQELQEEKRKLLILEQASNASLLVDKTGNLVAAKESVSDALTAAMMAAEEQAAVASGRRLRRRDEKAEGALNGLPPSSSTVPTTPSAVASSTTTANASRRKQVNNIYTYNTMLQEQDILDDLGAIAKEAGSLGTSRRAAAVIKTSGSATSAGNSAASTSVNVTFEKGVLHYNWDIIGVSDRIRVQLAPNSAPVHATVLSCSPMELAVSTNRSQIKILLSDLKAGKVTILTDDHLLHDN